MSGMFSSPKTPSPPPVPDPAPIPIVGEEVGEQAAIRTRKKRGFRKTIITGKLVPDTGKKTILG